MATACRKKISSGFHKEYSFLKCKRGVADITDSDRYEDKKIITGVLEAHYPDLAEVCKICESKTQASENVFGVGLRLTVSGGSGEASPILGKIFFKRDKATGEFLPLSQGDATKVNDVFFGDAAELSARGFEIEKGDNSADNGSLKEQIVSKLNDLVNSEGGFGEYLVLSSDKDFGVIEQILSKAANETELIVCQSVKLLSIIYVDWAMREYDVFDETGEALLHAKFGLGNALTLCCLACDSEDNVLVDSGVEAVDDVFDSHLEYTTCCGIGPTGGTCTRYLCQSNGVATNDDEMICRDCPHMERAVHYNGQKYCTSEMVYASDVNCLIPAEDAHECDICGRAVSQLETAAMLDVCPLCASLFEADKNKAKHKRYKKYCSMLTLRQRCVFTRKRVCVEDVSVILFRIGKSVYKLDKDRLDDDGYLCAPRKLK